MQKATSGEESYYSSHPSWQQAYKDDLKRHGIRDDVEASEGEFDETDENGGETETKISQGVAKEGTQKVRIQATTPTPIR